MTTIYRDNQNNNMWRRRKCHKLTSELSIYIMYCLDKNRLGCSHLPFDRCEKRRCDLLKEFSILFNIITLSHLGSYKKNV